MSHRPGGVNEETKHKLHQTPLFLSSLLPPIIVKVLEYLTVFTHGSISDTERNKHKHNNQCAYSSTSFDLLTHSIA